MLTVMQTGTCDPSSPLGAAGCLVDGVSGAIGGVSQTVGFWTDPWGNTFKTLQGSARDLSETVLPALTKATLPDLTADWFLKVYAVTFAIAILVAVVLLIPQILRTARGQQSGRDLADSIGLFFPLFLICAMFGPPIGALLVNLFGSLSDSITAWGVTGTAQTVVDKFTGMLSANDAAGIIGGAPIGVLLMLGMELGLVLVLVMLVVQLVTLYLTGVLLPLGIVWIIDPTRRKFGTRIVSVWLAVLASHPLLFLLLSFAYLMVASNIDVFSSPSLEKTVTLFVSLLCLFVAGLSPFALLKIAPVLPNGSGAANTPQFGSPSIGPRNLSEADDRYSKPGPDAGSNPTSSATDSDSVSSPTMPTAGPGGPGASTMSEAAAAGARTAAGSNPGMGAAAKFGAGEAGASGAAAGAEAAAGAGVAESATGVGAVIGVPTMLGAGAVAGFTAAKDAADGVGDHFAAPVEDAEQHGKDGGA